MTGPSLIYLEEGPQHAVSQARYALSSADGVVLFPTDTVYGLLAGLEAEQGYQRIFELKQRERIQPLQVLTLASTSLAEDVCAALAPWPDNLAQFTSGQATVVLDADRFSKLPAAIQEIQPGSAGIRLPGSLPLQQLLQDLPHQAAWATSANRTGQPALQSERSVLEACANWLAPVSVAVLTRAQLSNRASAVLKVTCEGILPLR